MPGDIFGHRNGRSAVSIYWVEVIDAVNILQHTGPLLTLTKNYPAHHINGSQVEKPCPKPKRKAEAGNTEESCPGLSSLSLALSKLQGLSCIHSKPSCIANIQALKSLNLIKSLYLTLSLLLLRHFSRVRLCATP